ncbi:MAG: NUMOD4 motif-containing HNH endonuclease [Treponema sp.]|nr:NUMOD4 motif-containing HNH endonuclease [Treponema sp.]
MSAEQDVLTWKVIPQTCGIYEVSNFGDIRERASGKILTVSQNSKGYAIVSLSKVGKLVKVHSVVAEMFVPKPTGDGNRLPPLQVDHIDGARMNNDARNLRWVTASENRKNAHRRGKYDIKGRGKKIRRICLATGESEVFGTLVEAAESTGMGWSSVRERLLTGRPTKSGYLFVYVGDGDGKD